MTNANQTSLATVKDIPTHKLVIKLHDGEFKTYYLTNLQAKAVMESINSKFQFIEITETNEAYPKSSVVLEKMTEQEMKDRQGRYLSTAKVYSQDQEEKSSEKLLKENSLKVQNWIKNNQEEYDAKITPRAIHTIENKYSQAKNMSEIAIKTLTGIEARKIVSSEILKLSTNSKGTNEN